MSDGRPASCLAWPAAVFTGNASAVVACPYRHAIALREPAGRGTACGHLVVSLGFPAPCTPVLEVTSADRSDRRDGTAGRDVLAPSQWGRVVPPPAPANDQHSSHMGFHVILASSTLRKICLGFPVRHLPCFCRSAPRLSPPKLRLAVGPVAPMLVLVPRAGRASASATRCKHHDGDDVLGRHLIHRTGTTWRGGQHPGPNARRGMPCAFGCDQCWA